LIVLATPAIIEHTFEWWCGGVGVRELEAAELAVRALQQVELAGAHPQTLLELTQRLFTLADQLDAALQRAIEQIHWTAASWEAAKLGPIRWLIEQCRRGPG
jgi:hypothetical protein